MCDLSLIKFTFIPCTVVKVFLISDISRIEELVDTCRSLVAHC